MRRFGVVDGTGDEDDTELESEGRAGGGSCWVILNKEEKKREEKT